jgi:glycosyltransferase 2 family protein
MSAAGEVAQRSGARAVKGISIAVAIALAAVLLFYSLRGIEWQRVWQLIADANPGWIAVALLLGTTTLFLRACRWRVLLSAEANVSVPNVFWATSAGYFGNNFLPARAGELVRTYMISAGYKLDLPFVLATALCERIADAITLVVIAAVVLLKLPGQSGGFAKAIPVFAALGIAGAAAIIILPLVGSTAAALVNHLPVPHRMRERLVAILEQGLRGLRAFHHVGRLSAFCGFSAAIWVLDAIATTITAKALSLSIPLSVAFLLLAAMGLGSALPSTPGYVGIYQFVAVTVLTPFGMSRTDAIAYILVAQALSYVVIGVWGAIGIARYRRTRRSM